MSGTRTRGDVLHEGDRMMVCRNVGPGKVLVSLRRPDGSTWYTVPMSAAELRAAADAAEAAG